MADRSSLRKANRAPALFSQERSLLSTQRTNALTLDLFNQNESDAHQLEFISIDEVGRGCLAGPVVVCASLWRFEELANHPDWVFHLRDSKKLSAAKREAIFTEVSASISIYGVLNAPTIKTKPLCSLEEDDVVRLQKPSAVAKYSGADLAKIDLKNATQKYAGCRLISASLGHASAHCIDRHGIIPALGVAATRALEGLVPAPLTNTLFFDGNRPLLLSKDWASKQQILVVQGDDHLKSISLSSVLAKVTRDRWMENYSQSYPDFAFHENRGYGTESHRTALAKQGPSPLHRTSFLKNICPGLFP